MQTHSFSDFDDFASSVRGVDSTMMLQNPKRFSWSMSHVDLPEIHAQLGRMGSGNIVEAQTSADGYLLYLSLTDTCECSANGTVMDNNAFMILEPGCEVYFSSKDEHDWCGILVPTHKLARSDAAEPPPGSEKPLCRVTQPNLQLATWFRVLVEQIMTTAAQCRQFETSPAATFAEAELLKVASSIVGKRQAGEPKHDGRPKLPRMRIIRRAQEQIEEHGNGPVRVEELATAAEVSERTLRTAFHEYFGVGPVRYLQLRQLHQVHSALRAAEPEAVSVGDVLVQHGEWEFSRFARRYRRVFGELPSETLRTRIL